MSEVTDKAVEAAVYLDDIQDVEENDPALLHADEESHLSDDADSTTSTIITDNDLSNLQKINPYIRSFPNFQAIIKNEAKELFIEIKTNLVKSVYFNETRPGLLHWTNRLEGFISEYGFYFTKEEHVQLVHLFVDILITPDLDFPLVEHFSNILIELLKKWDYLSHKDLVIEWRPLYNIYMRIHDVHDRSPILAPANMDRGIFNSLIKKARTYFPVEATKEMLDELRPLLCPYDVSFSRALERFELFLPMIIYPEDRDITFNLWANELLDLWISITTPHSWETHLISLFGRFACHSIGYFDWNPYIPFIFSHLLRGFGLPTFSGTGNKIHGNLNITSVSHMFAYSSHDISSICTWIVSMIDEKSNCIEYLKQLFQIIRSFYYPSNTGRWSSNLYAFLRQLPEAMIHRKLSEKRDRGKWHGFTPVENFLKETQINEFVNAIKDAVFTAIFSKTNQTDAVKAYQSLCFLRPEICLPYLIDKIYNSIESLTEPHRFTSILNCLVLVSRELVRYNKFCPAMQTHVIQLLTAVLPGLDGNDAKKSLISFQFLASILSSITVVNCTPALSLRDDLTEQERELCLLTAKFEDFIHEFFNKIFGLIETFSCDVSDVIMNYKNSNNVDDNIIEVGLSSTMNTLAQQSSNEFLKLMITKVSNYINGNVYNQKAGKMVASMCKALVKSNCAELAFKTFFTPLYENLKRIKEGKHFETALKNVRGDIEISWNIQLLQELLRVNGTILIKYISQIKDIINWYRECSHKITIQHLSSGIRHLLRSMLFFYPLEIHSTTQPLDFDDENAFKTFLPIRDWGKNGDLNSLNVSYHIPNNDEIKTAIEFVEEYVKLSISILNDKGDTIHKDDRYRELFFIYNLIVGSARLLKRPNRPIVDEHIDTQVNIGSGNDPDVSLSDLSNYNELPNENVRETTALFLLDYADKLLKQTDDTVALILSAKILSAISILYGLFRSEFEKQWKIFQTIKKQFENKLQGKKSHSRSLLIDRIVLQYEYRKFHIHTKLNDLDVKIIDCLFKLATSSYSEVRREGQAQLFNLLSHYPFSYLILTPKIKNLLTNENVNHDALKGCLYILKGNSLQSSFMVKHNWQIISQLWPALFQCKYYEKPSIQKLLDNIYESTNKNFDTFSFTTVLKESTLEFALKLHNIENVDNKKRLVIFEKRVEDTNKLIHELVDKIIEITRQSQSIWKTQAICFGTLIFLFYPFGKPSYNYVNIFVESLIHENVIIRKIAIAGMCIIVNMTKFEKPKIELNTRDVIKEFIGNENDIIINSSCPGERNDNQWHHLDNSKFKLPDSDSEWSEIKFIDKTYFGYYSWPAKIRVIQSKRRFYDQNAPDCAALKPIYDNFTNENYIQKLFKMLTIEEEKGKEKFDSKIFHLFKGLFRNFGDMLIPNLIERIKNLIRDRSKETHECSHRLASELCTALIRGSKYWPLSKLKSLWNDLKDVFDLIIDNMSPETLNFWHNCFSTAMEDQDPRRMVFYINYLKDLVIKKINEEQSSSFQLSSCLHLIRGLNQFEWRIPKIWVELYDALLPKMNHPYKAIREKLSNCLAFSLLFDVNFPNTSKLVTTAPRIDSFIDHISLKLDEAINLFKNIDDKSEAALSDDHKKAINFVQTLLSWFISYLARSLHPVRFSMIKIFSQLCCLDNIAAQDESTKVNLNIVRNYISIWYCNEECTLAIIKEIKKVLETESWHSKLAAIHIMQSFGVFNLFHLTNEIKSVVKEILIKYLTDEQLEVRLACAITLSGFIHSSSIQVDDQLINVFKKLSKTKAKSTDADGKVVLNTQKLVKRHGGILGLCAITSSSPYEIPSYLPDVVTYLCAFINDTAPIQNTVRKCLSEFRRTHHDNWQEHQLFFTEDQLYTINDVLISPNYYA